MLMGYHGIPVDSSVNMGYQWIAVLMGYQWIAVLMGFFFILFFFMKDRP